ncbi:MAG: trehalose-6-phosphate synthase [Dehalococcoidia bacterium]
MEGLKNRLDLPIIEWVSVAQGRRTGSPLLSGSSAETRTTGNSVRKSDGRDCLTGTRSQGRERRRGFGWKGVTSIRPELDDIATDRDAVASHPNRIILASNRGPLEYNFDKSGALRACGGNGGVATALTSLMPLGDFVWIASAMTEGDRRMAHAGRSRVEVDDHQCDQRFVVVPRRAYHQYYGVFSNPILWFLQHGLWDSLRAHDLAGRIRRSWEEGYLPVNRAFARCVAEELSNGTTPSYVMIQDYHLYMCPGYVRSLAPDVILQHFLHIPWPTPEDWSKLPHDIVRAICRSLLSADIVGFQTDVSAANFVETCRRFLPGVIASSSGDAVARGGRLTRVRAYPVSVDPERLRDQTLSLDFARYRKQLSQHLVRQTIVRVDRLDPSKNILGGLDAFELLLGRHPELIGQVRLLAFLVPSRGCVPEFRSHAQRVWRRIFDINDRFRQGDWEPIEAFAENNYTQALAGMSLYDVLLVNSLADGMNLVSKEGPLVNRRDGVVVLSTEVGSQRELAEGALSVAPGDVEGTADALWRALTMAEEERRHRAHQLRRVIVENDLRTWLQRQSEDLAEIAAERLSLPLPSPRPALALTAAG